MKNYPGLFLILVQLLHFSSYGQERQTACLEYHEKAHRDSSEYTEIYSLSRSKVRHFSISKTKQKTKKTRFKTTTSFTEAAHFLDSILAADYYMIQLDSVQIQTIISDYYWHTTYQMTDPDLKNNLDSLNRIRIEKQFFNRRIVIRSDIDSLHTTALFLTDVDYIPKDAVYFELKFSVNSKSRCNYASYVQIEPFRYNYATWLSFFLMQEKYALFDHSSPAAAIFSKYAIPDGVTRYLLWKKYGAPEKE